MLAMLEKLINEHGSSTILRERLELFSDKYSMLEDKNNHLSERNVELESQLQQAKQEIQSLRDELDKNAGSQSLVVLEDIEVQILKLLFDSNQDFIAVDLAQNFQTPIGNTEYHLNNLLEKKLINAFYSVIDDTRYHISADGRGYVIKNT